MPILLNSFGNCQTSVKGTGITNCDFESMGDYLGFALLNKGLTMPITNGSVDLSEAIVDGFIQNKQWHQFIDRLDFAQDTAENDVFTDGIGLESSVRTGKTKITTMFARGLEHAKNLHSFKGQSRWDMVLYFANGALFCTSVDGTKVKGFDVGRFDVTTIKFLMGTDKQQVSTIAQMTKPEELNDRALFIPYSKIGVDLSLKDGVIECLVTVVTKPTNSGTTMTVRVTSASNTDNPILGLSDPLFWATGGTQATPKVAPTAVAYNSSTGNYDMTFASPFVTNDTVQPRLRDTTKDVAKDVLGKFYTGRSVLTTV